MGNKNSIHIGLVVLLVLLSSALGVLGGYLIFNNNSNQEKEPEVNNQQQHNNEEKNFTLDDAKALMDNYKFNDGCGNRYLSDLTDEAITRYLAMRRISPDGKISCSSVEDTKFGKKNNVTCNYIKEFDYYSYQSVSESAKVLFGNDFIVNKESEYGYAIWPWHYISEHEKYVEITDISGGGDCPTILEMLDVYDFEIENDNLNIYTSRVLILENDESGDSVFTKTKYIFEKQDNNYYLKNTKNISQKKIIKKYGTYHLSGDDNL